MTQKDTPDSHLNRKVPKCQTLRDFINGASEEVRTLDIYLGKVVLYQLSYAREKGVTI